MQIRARHWRLVCAAFVVLTLGTPRIAPADAALTYSGRAFAAYVDVPTLGVGPLFVSDTGELPPSGGFQSAQLTSIEVPGVLRASLLVSQTSGANGVAESSASLVEAIVLPGQEAQVTANFVRAESEANCNRVRGSTEVTEVTFGDQAIAVDPFAPNQTVVIPDPTGGSPLATLVINEQRMTSGGGFRAILVNALHLTLKTGDEVILASAHSDVNGCPGCPPLPACDDFVTGGGWIKAGSGRANFGFNAGFKGGSVTPVAHFNYVDRGAGIHMKAIDVARYAPGASSTSRVFEGEAEINGVPGFTYRVEVADHGEPGRRADTLTIDLSNGYSAGGTLEGGNIQLHKPCP